MAEDNPGKPNVVLVAIALFVTVFEVVNVISALRDDTVWILRKSDFIPSPLERADDPFSFYVILLLGLAFAGWLNVDLWRRYRNQRRKGG